MIKNDRVQQKPEIGIAYHNNVNVLVVNKRENDRMVERGLPSRIRDSVNVSAMGEKKKTQHV
jgi:hypothetical protein